MINNNVSVDNTSDTWVYYVNMFPIYSHDHDQRNHFRYIVASLIETGACRQCEIVKTFGVDRKMLNRAQRQLKERGIESFFQKKFVPKSRGTVLTPEKISQAQSLLNDGLSRSQVCAKLSVKSDTLRKAIKDGRLSEPEHKVESQNASTLSGRTKQDAACAEQMGVGCTNQLDRVAACIGMIDGVETRFEKSLDVPMAGVLCALPALLSNGLLNNADKLGDVHGYYTRTQILLVLVFMMLCRIKSVEQLRDYAPGELGKLLGLDRIPEARCLREKMDTLSEGNHASEWAADLGKQWLEQTEHAKGFLYVDGHVKVYGGQIELPRRFVSRQRLCLRGITYYWVNDAIGQPLFVVEKQIDSGLIKALKEEIIPWLIKEVPNQPSEEEINNDPLLHRFVIVFDREGYSPDFFQYLWDTHRIGCLSYKKNVTDTWSEDEFVETETITPGGEKVKMKIAQRDTCIGKKDFVVKEVRKLSESGHQTTIVCTARKLNAQEIAPNMFTRWSQENFFGYAMEHFNIDALTSNLTETFSGTQRLVNPKWREIDKQQRKLNGQLTRARAKYLHMDTQKRAEPSHKKHDVWELDKAEMHEMIENLQKDVEKLKAEKKEIDHYVDFKDLEETEQFKKLSSTRRTLLNTIGMIAYRGETAMGLSLTNDHFSLTDARAVLQGLFTTHGDIIPDEDNNILNIHLHGAATLRDNKTVKNLIDQLNQTETVFPDTNMIMVFHSILDSD